MGWQKKRLIFVPDFNNEWSKTHAQVPTVDVISDEILRIYYAARDSKNRSNISYFDVSLKNPSNIIYVHKEPILPLGNLGTFDDSGLMPSSIVTVDNIKYLYYTGWNVRKSVPYHNSIGLAVSYDGGATFERKFEGPVLGIIANEPYFIGTSCVLYENKKWKNWYAACTEWNIVNENPEPRYHIKYAESDDGINWIRNGHVAIDYKNNMEAAIVRASVIKDDVYKMWFSYRQDIDYRTDKTKSYRIGYAASVDGVHWKRQDELSGIDIADSGWDSEMIAYACVISVDNKKYMFYNGNGFGATGIGYAEWIDEK